MYRHSGIDPLLTGIHGNTGLAVYRDQAYGLNPHLLTPFAGAVLTADETAFNVSMGQMCESMEWGFGKLKTLFAFCSYSKNQKVYLQPIGQYFIASTILMNCYTCLYRSVTNSFFGCNAPVLNQYLA